MRRRPWLGMLVFALVGCRQTTPTQLVVVVQTDLQVGAEVDALAILVGGKAPAGDPFALESQASFPASFGVKPRDGDASRRVTIDVTALSHGTAVVTQRAVTTFVTDARMRVDLYLSRSCRSVGCDEPGQTCWFGQCIDALIAEGELRPFRPGDPALDAGVTLDAGTSQDAAAPVDAGLDAAADAAADAGSLGALGDLCSPLDLCEEGLLCSSWDLITEIPDPGTCLRECLSAGDCQPIHADASCIPTDGRVGFCTQPCDPRGLPGECPAGTRCTILGFEAGTVTATLCVAPGSQALGEACTPTTCDAPNHCINIGGELCRAACDMDAPTCPPETPTCGNLNPRLVVGGTTYGVCRP